MMGKVSVMETALILSQHVQLSSLLRTGVRAKFRTGRPFGIDFLNVTSGLYKAKVNITMRSEEHTSDSSHSGQSRMPSSA